MDLEHLPIMEHEIRESVPERYAKAQKLSMVERVKLIMNDPECRKCLDALGRSGFNFGVAVVDLFPLVGDALEAAVLSAKVSVPSLKFIISILSKRLAQHVEKLDTTPDIPKYQQVGTSIALLPVEVASGGTAPTALINALRQLKADRDRGNFADLRRTMAILIEGVDPKPITPAIKEILDESSNVFTQRNK